jgi:hypothetical protein
MIIKDSNDGNILTVPLDLAGYMSILKTDYLLLKKLLLLNSTAEHKVKLHGTCPRSLIRWQTHFTSKSLRLRIKTFVQVLLLKVFQLRYLIVLDNTIIKISPFMTLRINHV